MSNDIGSSDVQTIGLSSGFLVSKLSDKYNKRSPIARRSNFPYI